jgi:hypothetical protein
MPLLKENTKHRLRIYTKRHLLHLHRLKQLRCLPRRILGGLLLLLPLQLFGLLLLLGGGLGIRGLGFDLLDCFLCGAALLVLHAEGLVDDDLVLFGDFIAAFWRHGDGGTRVWLWGSLRVYEGVFGGESGYQYQLSQAIYLVEGFGGVGV